MTRPVIGDQRTALLGGVLFVVLGAWMIHEAYDARGKRPPFALRFLPGF